MTTKSCAASLSLSRRRFLGRTAGLGMAAGIGPWLAACGITDRTTGSGRERENLAHYFSLASARPNVDYSIVAGRREFPMRPLTAVDLVPASGLLGGNGKATHVSIDLSLPADSMQMLQLRGTPRDSADPTAWTLKHIYFHLPTKARNNVKRALHVSRMQAGAPELRVRRALGEGAKFSVATNDDRLSYCTVDDDPDDPDGTRQMKDAFDHAIALVSHHPEILTFDNEALAYIHTLICRSATIEDLADSLLDQGEASEQGGWATLIPDIDPATGQPRLDKNGKKIYYVRYSQETLRLVGAAVNALLPVIKDDPLLGANITSLQPDPKKAPDELAGKIWVVRNRSSARQAEPAPAAALAAKFGSLAAGSDRSWGVRDVTTGPGLSIEDVSGTGNSVSFTVRNWYLRHLGLYIRFYNAAGGAIAYGDLPSDVKSQFDGNFTARTLSGGDDCFLAIINPELVVMGIPVKQSTQRFNITVPDAAASFEICCGGIGSGTVPAGYGNTLPGGQIMTSIFEFVIPGLFLIYGAVSGYKTWQAQTLGDYDLLVTAAATMVSVVQTTTSVGFGGDQAEFYNAIYPIAKLLIKSVARLATLLEEDIAEGEAEGALEDAIPFGIGIVLQIIEAAALAAQIAETSAEVARSPWVYRTLVSSTHNVAVAINRDPNRVTFPRVAKFYQLTAIFDQGTPVTSTLIGIDGPTPSDPLSYTFYNVPAGGAVNITVHFYSENGWLAGQGSTGPVSNLDPTQSITITENLVPLRVDTVYSHLQKTALNANGDHVWVATTTPPAPPPLSPACGVTPGQLCDLTSISLSSHFGALGYSWLAYSRDTRDFNTRAAGQLHQFANLSITNHPQRGYLHSGGGSTAPMYLAYSSASVTSRNYYIDGSGDLPVVRRINTPGVDQRPTFDAPGSNRAVGRLHFPSDGIALHPTGKLISINTARSKLEILDPLDDPVADDVAPLATPVSGPGTREGLIQGPACIAVAPSGHILVLEQLNNRLQAFDTAGHPANAFGNSPFLQLRAASANARFLDISMEFMGYLYVLYRDGNGVCQLDIYRPDGTFLVNTPGFNAGKITLDLARSVYALNWEVLQPVGAITEPSLSIWIPSTPPATLS